MLIDSDDIQALREALEAKGFRIMTQSEADWIDKPMTVWDADLVEEAKKRTPMEWTEIEPDEAETYRGWKALDDISRRLYHQENFGR